MSHSNSTQYYSLPQFESTDKPAWLVDVNPAYAAIDTGIHAAKAAADAAQGDATQALSDASSAGTTASGADAKAAGSLASIADAFDATATYSVGDCVMYNSLLYICTTAVTNPGPWTGVTNWTRTTTETEINKKQNPISAGAGISIASNTVSVSTETKQVLTPVSGVSLGGSGGYAMRSGNMVVMSINCTITASQSGWYTMANIDSDFTPIEVSQAIVIADNNLSTFFEARVTTEGEFQIYSPETGNRFWGNITWVI